MHARLDVYIIYSVRAEGLERRRTGAMGGGGEEG